jgi:hypothetical protein
MLIAEMRTISDYEERADEDIFTAKVKSRLQSVFNEFVESPSVIVIW